MTKNISVSEPEFAIKVDNIGKVFKLPHEKSNSLKSALISFRKRRTYENQVALRDISFEIKKGEFFGIVGRNGSGKSTLLKLLAGIYTPTEGNITINGSLTPFIELGVGFNPELTGRENVFLNGALLGFNRKQMSKLYNDIVEFAELERFMDQKLKNYSSGMQVRLAFAIAIQARSDILILDEVLAVGDESFQKKCRDYFQDVKNSHQTVVLVTHSMDTVIDFCDRAILINNGKLELDRDVKTVTEAYQEINRQATTEAPERLMAAEDVVENDAKLVEVKVLDSKTNHAKSFFKPSDEIKILARYKVAKDIEDATIDLGIKLGRGGQYYFYTSTDEHDIKVSAKAGTELQLVCSFKNIFHSGKFYIATSLYDLDSMHVYARDRNAANFDAADITSAGLAIPEHKLELKRID